MALALACGGGTAAGRRSGAADEHPHIERQNWTFGGLFGHFDDAQLQRGFKIYSEVCSRCHSIKRLNFRNLAAARRPRFPGGRHQVAGSQLPG